MIGREAGKHSEALKRLRRLVRDRRERLAEGLCVIEGRRVVEDYLEGGGPVELAVASKSRDDAPELLRVLSERSAELLRVDEEALVSLADTKSPQGFLLAVPRPATGTLPAAAGRPVLVAWELQDPSNAGALVRAAAAAGAAAALFARADGGALVDPLSPRAVRASAGSCFRLTLVERCGTPEDLAAELRAAGYAPAALTPRGGRAPEQASLGGAAALIVGSEAHGLPPALESCGERLSLPLEAGVESLGAAAAGAVVLFEAARQRRLEAPGEEG